ncbi:MAG: aminotransferase, partial [Coriobacteriales bacterium]|nr:aminotransferase [Coriobacteriales bacterium]
QIIGYDKINHLRHAKFLKDKAGTLEHMKKHAEIIRPKFECVLQTMDDELAEYKCEIKWAHPKGGYFIYFEGAKGSAKRIVKLAKNAGMVLTGAGSVWPYGKDPYDNALRICPTYPPIEELELAAKLFCICAKIATIETLL